jgi:hypothetical protein
MQKPCIDTCFVSVLLEFFCELPGENQMLDFHTKKNILYSF